jgi:hypothetical protein
VSSRDRVLFPGSSTEPFWFVPEKERAEVDRLAHRHISVFTYSTGMTKPLGALPMPERALPPAPAQTQRQSRTGKNRSLELPFPGTNEQKT